MTSNRRFNLRVYGIIINEMDEVLLSDERRHGHSFTKFPGGGLEFGEGTKDCLRREIEEELNLDATIGDLFYVNDFYQESAFRKEDQLISFYYRVSEIDTASIETSSISEPLSEDGERFRWVSLQELSEDMLTFPIDKVVAATLTGK